MTLDPQARILLDTLLAMGGPELHTLPVAEARQAMARLTQMQGEGESVASVEDRRLPGPAGEIPVRVYRARLDAHLPALMWFHGGGWVLGDIDTHDRLCRSLANRIGCTVVSVDYRLAPEHRFPAAAEDCYAATAWVVDNAETLHCDSRRVAIGGDSAGGNLSAVVAQMARDRGGPALIFQLLVYPVTDASLETPSYRDNAEGYLLSAAGMRWFWDHYVPNAVDRANPYAAPLRATRLTDLPPALVITAGFDPLRDEGEAYAEALKQAGIATTLTRYPGMIHGFFGMESLLSEAGRAMDQATGALRHAFQLE